MDIKDRYVIPRNIRIKETVAYGLNGKQVLYLAMGIGGSLLVWSITSGLPIGITKKVAMSLICIIGSIALSLSKIHGQDLDRYIFNSIKFVLRNKEFGSNDEESDTSPVLNIKYTT